MPDKPLTIAAVVDLAGLIEHLNSLDKPRAATVAEDFLYQDRRSGGVSFGSTDASGFLAALAQHGMSAVTGPTL